MARRWAPLKVLIPALALGALALTPTIAGAATATPATPATPATGLALAAPAQVSSGQARMLGAADPAQRLRLVIGLKSPHAAEEETFLASLQDKKSPNFHKYLTADQWNARFGPTAASEAKVTAWAAQNGLTVTQRYANHLVIDVDGSIATVQKAFAVKINNYQLGTTSFYSNDKSVALSSAVAPLVSSVQGMNSLQTLKPSNPAANSAFPAYTAGPVKATAGSGGADGKRSALVKAQAASKGKAAKAGGLTPGVTSNAYDPTDIYSSQAYDVDALNAQGHCCNPTNNSGVTPPATSIAIATAGQHNASDYAGFHNQYPYLAYHYQEYFIDGTPVCCDLEGTMDFEWSTAMANSFGSAANTAMVYMYDGANSNLSTFTDIWNHMLSDGKARTMSTSWGCAETYCYDSGTMDTDHDIFNAMLGQGWTLVGISHDKGPYSDCSHVSANYPGSDPDLVSAGGTTLQAAGVFQSEVAWTGGTSAGSCNNNNGGGGGGCSNHFAKPGWQSVATQCSNRAEPDLSLNAAINQNIYFGGTLRGSGGTSIVAPELAGIFAQANAYLRALGNACSGNTVCPTIGDPHYDLYNANSGSPHHPYYDITSGCTSNDVGAGYCATTGYDLATGLGSANLYQLVSSILWYNVPEATAPSISISGPGSGYHSGGTLSWSVADSGGSYPATGVAGYSYRWDSDPGNPTSAAHGGSGNSFYSGPTYKNATTGSVSLSSAGSGCHTLYVRAWDNIGDSSVNTYSTCYDATAPTVTSAPTAKFITGALHSGAPPIRVSWTGSDSGSGVQGYYVYRSTDSGSFAYQGFQSANSITQYLTSGHHYQYEVYALDNASNQSAVSASPNFSLHTVQENSSSIAFSSGWTTQTLSGASGGKVKYSSAASKTAKLTYTGNRVAWVTTLGSTHGSAKVSADGGTASTVNTNKSSTTAGYVQYVGISATLKSHTLLVTNLGTSGKPRVDVDAFMYIGS